MDIEQLKLIISAIQGVAGDARTALIWWMVIQFAMWVGGWSLLAGVVVYIVKTIATIVRKSMEPVEEAEKNYRKRVLLEAYRAWIWSDDNGKTGISYDEYDGIAKLLGTSADAVMTEAHKQEENE